MKLKDLGEFELIELMARAFRREPSDFLSAGTPTGLVVGIGDDAAVWSTSNGFAIATTDAMVEGIHFSAETTDWYDLGWKAVASNISDIAGMGGAPLYALAVLAVSGDQAVDDILQLCSGMADMAWEFGAVVVGGDTVSSPVTTISVTLIGNAVGGRHGDKPPVLSRYAARPGDAIAVTGTLGSSAGGLELMLNNSSGISERFAPLVKAHRRPIPRVREGQLLLEAGVRCGMDLSDGLSGDILRICKASGVGAEIEIDRLPIDPLLDEAFGDRAHDLALSGGEDYELLCSAPHDVIESACSLLDSLGTSLTVVGKIVDGSEGRVPLTLVGLDGRIQSPPSGWEHFKAGGDAARS